MDSLEPIKQKIYEIRGRRVMLDSDLAELYAVETRTLNQAVKRNVERFPGDFMFQLTKEEWDSLKSRNEYAIALTSQNVILKKNGRGQHSKCAQRDCPPVHMYTGILLYILFQIFSRKSCCCTN